MSRKKIDFSIVRELALALPGVEESTSYGAPSLKVGGKLLACMAQDKAAEPNTLAIGISIEQRTAWIAAAPDIYYATKHYLNYAVVLIRLDAVDRDELRGALEQAWRFATTKKKRKK